MWLVGDPSRHSRTHARHSQSGSRHERAPPPRHSGGKGASAGYEQAALRVQAVLPVSNGQAGGNKMKHIVVALSMGAIVLMARTVPAMPVPGGQQMPPDHLVCYKMTDPLRLKTQLDLFAQIQPEFSQQGCTLIKPIEFCVPATKLNVTPAPPDPNIAGVALKNDYICYLAKCPKVPPPTKDVIDQFGTRTESHFQVTKVCVPAIKNTTRCPVGLIKKGGPACGGACPSRTQLCKTVKTPAGPTCECVDQTKPCGGPPDAAGLCGGTCPAPESCRPGVVANSASGKQSVLCNCQPPPPPVCGINTATGQCGGSCDDPTQKCIFDTTVDPPQCHCGNVNLPCHATSTGLCGTTATPCLSNADCPKGVTCTQGAPVCGGDCPPQESCLADATTGKCSCQGSGNTCSQDPLTGQCGGPCPQGQVCVLDSTGHCGCQSAPCGSVTLADGTSTCGGPCPQICLGGSNPGAPCTSDTQCTGACSGNKCQDGTFCNIDADCNGTCGGTCKADATGACNCQKNSTPDPCLNSTTCAPVPCPGTQQCSIVPGTTFCRCQCDAASCGTSCPSGTTCSLVGSGPQCACQ